MSNVVSIGSFKKPKKTNTEKLIEFDDKLSREIALKIVEHTNKTTTAPFIDKDRIKYIFDEISLHVNNMC